MRSASVRGLGQTSQGSVYFRDSYLPLDHRHGKLRLESALQGSLSALGGRAASLSKDDLRQAAFIDIETGPQSELSGSYAFVVGVGRFEPYYFRLRQLFHREGSSMPGLLDAFSELLSEARCVVTFNGTTFDLPYLSACFSQAGLPNPLEDLPHLDLLQVARRVYGTGLKSRRLQEVERSVLGFERPRQTQFLRDDHPILEHNALDVLSLVVLLSHLNRHARKLAKTDPRYLVSIGRLNQEQGRLSAASDSFRSAWRLDPRGLAGGEAIVRLSKLLNTAGEWRSSAGLWDEELQLCPRPERRIRAHLELAKLHERRLKDRDAALDNARHALALIEQATSMHVYARSYADLSKRIHRLEKVAISTEPEDEGHVPGPRD